MSIRLESFNYVSTGRIESIKRMFREDYEKNRREYTFKASEFNTSLYYDVIKKHIPWVKATKLSDRKLKIIILKPTS